MSNAGESIFENAIYFGKIRHQRYVDARHGFEYRMFCLWLRVSEVDQPSLKLPGLGRGAFGLVTVQASDYMAHRRESTLEDRIRGEIKDKANCDWNGEAYLLGQPRYLGFVMNPLTLFYCYDHAKQLAFIVGEITNTPWGERHCYVFPMTQTPSDRPQAFELAKEFHVSPFLPMNMRYTWRLSSPSRYLSVGIWNRTGERLDFEAHMTLERMGLSTLGMLTNLIKMPLMTWKIWLGIYVNAGILYAVKRVTFYSHPRKSLN